MPCGHHSNKTNHVFQANPGGHNNLTLLGQLTDSSLSDESSHKSATFSNDANTNDISSILEKIDDQSQQAIGNAKIHIGTRVTVRCEFSPSYFLHRELPGLMLSLKFTLLILTKKTMQSHNNIWKMSCLFCVR